MASAIVLISGGLDSILAAKVLKNLGIQVIALNFKIPFCHRTNKKSKTQGLNSLVKESLGLDLTFVDISNEFLKLLSNPRYGFGANMNPCIDCKILMLTKARQLMCDLGMDFVATGEVLGQRPMSQHRRALELIAKQAGLAGLLLRPLCAKLLPETIPEQKGLISRQNLLDFNGRSRKPQIELAEKFGIKDYPNPAGGCLLTDAGFASRLKDLISHQELNIDNVELLKIGRHFRISNFAKLIVGRNEFENEQLTALALDNDYLFMPNDELAGPTSLGRGVFDEELINLSCQITCRYCDLNGAQEGKVIVKKGDSNYQAVIPAKAGIQQVCLDSGVRRNDFKAFMI